MFGNYVQLEMPVALSGLIVVVFLSKWILMRVMLRNHNLFDDCTKVATHHSDHHFLIVTVLLPISLHIMLISSVN